MTLRILSLFFIMAGMAPAAEPVIESSPKDPLMDEMFIVKATGLPANVAVQVRASTLRNKQMWQAEATYTTSAGGTLDLSDTAPIAGSYTGVDPLGLIWTMQPMEGEVKDAQPLARTDPRIITFEVVMDNKVMATHEVRRSLCRPDVKVTEVREQGLVGRLFEPAGGGKRPAVIVLSGSEGGFSETEAALQASRGRVAFALAYFGVDGVPKQLVNIPLEYFRTGLDWLKRRDSVDGNRIGVMGGSRGGELALLLGATYPDIKCVVASVPSHVVWPGLGATNTEPSWTRGGQPLPTVPGRPPADFFLRFATGKPVVLLELFENGLKDEERVKAAVIPVENIQGPVLLLSGKADQMWPSAKMADEVVARLKAKNHPHEVQHLSYADAGHALLPIFVPTRDTVAGGRYVLGGTPTGNAKAIADARPRVLRFLAQNLAEKR